MPDETEPSIVEMVFFGPRAEEIIGCPLDALINDDIGVGAFIPLRIAMLYGKQFELRVSVSSMSLQSASITYQVDAIIGIPDMPAPLPASVHERKSITYLI